MICNGADVALQLPTRSPLLGAAAPIEVWVHSSLVPSKIAKEVRTIFNSPDQSAVVNAMALLPGILGKEAAAAITAFAAEQNVGLENVGEWLVIDVNGAKNATNAATIARGQAVSGGSIRR